MADECGASFLTYSYADICPLNEKDWQTRAMLKNCSSISQTCGGKPLEYHCLLNAYQNKSIEVCAPKTRLIKDYCPSYSLYGKRITDQFNCTRQYGDGCPKTQLWSNMIFEYPDCLKQRHVTLTTVSERPTDPSVTAPYNISNVTTNITMTIQIQEDEAYVQNLVVPFISVFIVIAVIFGIAVLLKLLKRHWYHTIFEGHGRSSRYTWESMEGGTALFCRGENTKLCWPDIQSRRSRESLYGKTELYHNQLTNRTSTDIGVCNEQTEPDQLGINDQDETSGLLIHAEHKTGIEGSFPKFSLDSENAQSLPIPVTANDQNITPKQRPTGEGSDHNIQGQNNNDQIQNVKISKKKKLEKLDMVSSTLDSSKQDTSVHIDNSTSGEGCEGTITMKTNSPIKEKEEEENMEKDCQTENCFSSSETNTVNIAKSREKIDENGHIKRDENESPKSMATRTWTRNRKNQTDINRRGKQSDIQKNRKDYHRAVLQDSETSDFPVGVENNRNQSTYEEPISNKEHNEMTPFPNQYTKCEEEEESRLKDMHSEKSTLYATTCNSTNTPYTTGSNQSPEIVDNSLQESLFLDNEHASFEITQGVLQENSFIEKMDLNTSVSHPDSVTECGKNDPTTKNTTPFDNSKANKCTNLDTLPSQSLDNISNISDTYIKHEISNTTIPESSNRTWNFNNSENRIDQTRNPAQIWNEDTQVKTEAICTQQDSGMLNERPETYSFFTQLIPMVVNATLTQMNAASAEKVNNDKLKSKENELRGCSDNDRRWTPDQAQQISNMNERIKQLQRRIEEASELRSKIQLHEKEKEKLKMEIKNLKTQIESIKLDENKRRYEIEQRLNEQRLDFENQLRQHKQDLENHLAKQKVDLEREIERKNELLVRKDETIERLQHELEDRERVIESLLRERQQANTSANDC